MLTPEVCISGALVGAYFGFDALMGNKTTKSNWKVLIKAAKRVDGELAKYVPGNFDELVDNYINAISHENNISQEENSD